VCLDDRLKQIIVGNACEDAYKENASRYFDVGEQLPHVCFTIKQTLVNICPDTVVLLFYQCHAYSSNAAAFVQICCTDGAPELLKYCLVAAKRVRRRYSADAATLVRM
jgi:hypothetical protein